MTRKIKLFLCSAAALAATPLKAETLRDALTQAYNTNPTLTGARAGQRATDEGVPIAKAQGRPDASGTASYTELMESRITSTSFLIYILHYLLQTM